MATKTLNLDDFVQRSNPYHRGQVEAGWLALAEVACMDIQAAVQAKFDSASAEGRAHGLTVVMPDGQTTFRAWLQPDGTVGDPEFAYCGRKLVYNDPRLPKFAREALLWASYDTLNMAGVECVAGVVWQMAKCSNPEDQPAHLRDAWLAECPKAQD